VFAACHNYKADVEKLQKEKAELMTSASYKDSTITGFINEVNDIESNLAQVETKQSNIAMAAKNNELKGNQADRIKANIAAINDLMKENKEKLAALNAKMKNSGAKLAGFEKMVTALNQQIADKDRQLAELNDKLAALNTTVEKLNTDVSTLTATKEEHEKTIADQTQKLHTAYYTVGTSKDLRQKKVVQPVGGVLGIGRVEKMPGNYNNSAFTTIDITQTQTIPLNAKEVKVLTTHPSDSYTLQHEGKEKVSSLVITDPDKFWKTSKYLVVEVEK
jgi:predicted  nucleic acid-binding Zn-ribbon protein